MPDLISIIKERRSIRKYEDRKVSEKDIKKLIEAVRWSPSWTNSQCWEVIIIKNPITKAKLQDTLPPKGNPAKESIVQAPVLLALCSKMMISGYYNKKAATKFGDWCMYDLGIATQSLCLMAHQIGLGTVIVGLYDHEAAKKILNVPEGYELMTIIPLGYPSKIGNAPKRREIDQITHNEFFKNT